MIWLSLVLYLLGGYLHIQSTISITSLCNEKPHKVNVLIVAGLIWPLVSLWFFSKKIRQIIKGR